MTVRLQPHRSFECVKLWVFLIATNRQSTDIQSVSGKNWCGVQETNSKIIPELMLAQDQCISLLIADIHDPNAGTYQSGPQMMESNLEGAIHIA